MNLCYVLMDGMKQ